MTALEAGFNMPWYVWAWAIIVFWFGWPTLFPGLCEHKQEDYKEFDKYQIPPVGASLVPKSVTDYKLWSEHCRRHSAIFERLKKGDKIVEGDPDYEMYTLMRNTYDTEKAYRQRSK